MFATIGVFDSEVTNNELPKRLLTGTDTLLGYEVLDDADFTGATAWLATITAVYPAIDTMAEITGLMVNNPDITGYVDPLLAAGTAVGQLDHPSNLLKYQVDNLRVDTVANTWNNVEQFDVGSFVNGDFNGSEIALIRQRIGAYSAQFFNDNVRMIRINVAITQPASNVGINGWSNA